MCVYFFFKLTLQKVIFFANKLANYNDFLRAGGGGVLINLNHFRSYQENAYQYELFFILVFRNLMRKKKSDYSTSGYRKLISDDSVL